MTVCARARSPSITYTTLPPSRDASAVVGQCDSRAARIVGISLTAYEPEVDGLLHEPRGARLINTDRLAELAHR